MTHFWTSHIARLCPGDLGAFEGHLLRLSGEVRAERFGRAMSDEQIGAYCRRRQWTAHVLVCTVDGAVRGAGEFLPCDDVGRVAETTFSVEPAWQGRGIGTALMHAVMAAALQRGIGGILVHCDALNRRMQRIASRFEARMLFSDGECIGRIRTNSRGGAMRVAALAA